jgi:hypothetical protein
MDGRWEIVPSRMRIAQGVPQRLHLVDKSADSLYPDRCDQPIG